MEKSSLVLSCPCGRDHVVTISAAKARPEANVARRSTASARSRGGVDDATVAEIRRLWTEGKMTSIAIGKMFGVSSSSVRKIGSGRRRRFSGVSPASP